MTQALATVAPMVGKLIRLLASDRDGELVATVHALRRVLHSVGLDLHDLANAIELAPAPTTAWSEAADAEDDPEEAWRRMRTACLRHGRRLTAKERAFLINIDDWSGPLTERQQAWLDSIHARLHREAA